MRAPKKLKNCNSHGKVYFNTYFLKTSNIPQRSNLNPSSYGETIWCYLKKLSHCIFIRKFKIFKRKKLIKKKGQVRKDF